MAISPGVSPGDEFIYDIKVFFNSANQSVVIPNEMLRINRTDYFKVRITEVEEEEVTMQTTWRFTNGTEIEGQGNINLETGTRSGDFWTIIGSNLNAGDKIRPMGFDRTPINYTITRNYGPGGNRETNVIDITYSLYNENDPSITGTEYSKTYFDKQTGMLVEIEDMIVLSEPLTTQTLSWKIKETNKWTIPEFPSVHILAVLLVVSLVLLLSYKKKNLGNSVLN
jgi:hypothetical protein